LHDRRVKRTILVTKMSWCLSSSHDNVVLLCFIVLIHPLHCIGPHDVLSHAAIVVCIATNMHHELPVFMLLITRLKQFETRFWN
jgi:hypothetical protein